MSSKTPGAKPERCSRATAPLVGRGTVADVTIRLTTKEAVWRAHVADLATRVPGLVPVVKGNGYGFGRAWLAGVAAEIADTIAVGTVHELDGLPGDVEVVVLTPTLTPPSSPGAILTVGRHEHVDVLRGWSGSVIVKLSSQMRRYGGDADLVGAAQATGLQVVGVAIHPPLVGEPVERADQIEERLDETPVDLPIWTSHVELDDHRRLVAAHPDRTFRLRLGTALWHGDKRALHLEADVLDVRPIAAGETAGYRLGSVPSDGHLVMIGAGTANGISALPDGRSPFHFQRTRIALHEPPHMHTSMVFVPSADPLPRVGDWVDVQRPLTMTMVDEYRWV